MSERTEEVETRQERREKRLERKKEKIPQHGRGLGRLYKEAILKRINQLRGDKKRRNRIEERKKA
jgi:hypothetical protein